MLARSQTLIKAAKELRASFQRWCFAAVGAEAQTSSRSSSRSPAIGSHRFRGMLKVLF